MNKSSKRTIRAIIFDFDGTIADSFEIFVDTLKVITKNNINVSDKQINELRGFSLQDVIKKLDIKSWQLLWLVFRGRRELSKKMHLIKAFDGMPNVMSQLSIEGYSMYILSTNGKKNIDQFLKANDLTRYVKGVYGNIGVWGKLAGLKKLQREEMLRASDCLYIGDETRDIEAAQKANIKSIAVGWGFSNPKTLESYNPDALVNDPSDLLKCIEAIASKNT